VDNGKNIMTLFDGGFSFPKQEGNDNRTRFEDVL
jgi:hypothetical protein